MSASFGTATAKRTSRLASSSARTGWPAPAIVAAAVSFNFVLCFINTNVAAINSAAVIGAEVVIISLAIVASARSLTEAQLITMTVTIAFVLVLAMARAVFSPDAEFDVKIARDLLIPFAFFMLGCGIVDLRQADLIVKACAICVVAVGLFEYVFVETFLRYFNVIMYYVGRGSVEMQRLELLSTNLFVSGVRPEGRSLLPFLGDHRVSSLFLEPVSPGNFAVIIFSWALVRARIDGRIQWSVFAAAAVIVVMADNRFGAYLCVLSTLLILLPRRISDLAVECLPPLIVTMLLGMAATLPYRPADDGIIGRALSAGRVLASFDAADWLGLGNGAADAFDSGYAYTISQIGVPAAAFLWLLLMTLKSSSAKFQSFRMLTGLYFSTILAVSYSPYTIKTGSLLWFLLGALYSEKLESGDAPK